MPKSTQAKLADWTLACGASSFVMPIVAFIFLAGAGSINALWFQLAGLVVFAGISFWMLSRIAKAQFAYPALSWLTSLIYFVAVMMAIIGAFRSPMLVAALCLPEIAGAALCFVGIGHLIHLRRNHA